VREPWKEYRISIDVAPGARRAVERAHGADHDDDEVNDSEDSNDE